MDLWNTDRPVSDFDIDVPAWIESDISCADVAAIVQGGCASGAYMPAVTYHKALETMADYGDSILDYIESALGEIPQPESGTSWAGMACHYVSIAVELWAASAESELEAIEVEE